MTDGAATVPKRLPVQVFLLPNALTGSTAVQANLTAMGASWRRTLGLQWGPLVGTFQLEGDESKLAEYMNNWLGLHVQERAMRTTWEGIIVDLTLHSGVVTRRSLDNVWNRVRAKYGNHIENGGFETLDPGSPVFLHWTESAGTPAVETDEPGSGTRSAQLTNPTDIIYQDMTSLINTPGTYRLSFTCNGSSPKYQVEGSAGGGFFSDIIALTTVDPLPTTTSHKRYSDEFLVSEALVASNYPATVRVHLKGVGIFDDMELRRIEEGRPAASYTAWAVNQGSINAFGTREWTADGKELGPTNSDRLRDSILTRRGWPVPERLPQMGKSGKAVLEGMVIGYGLTTDWVYTQLQMFGSSGLADVTMATLLAEAEYIQSIAVAANAYPVRLEMNREKRLREAIEEVVEQAGDDGNYWQIYMARDRRAIFKPINFTPKYYLQNGELRSSLNGPIVDPWLVVPGIVRNVAAPHGSDYPGSPYQDKRDFIMDEVVVDNGKLTWTPGDFIR